MTISRRVTARFHKRVRKASPVGASVASPSVDHREEPEVRILPVTETRSGFVAPRTARLTYAPTSESLGLSAHLRRARSRAEQVLREHPRHEDPTIPTCQVCLLAYPCDAVQIAEDVIAISEKLQVDRLRSSKALLEFMTDLVDQGSIGRP